MLLHMSFFCCTFASNYQIIYMNKTDRLANVEWLRILAIMAVVLIHSDTCYTSIVLPATRFAVPLFFMISGYFIGNPSKCINWRKYIIKSLWVLLGSTLFYGLVRCIECSLVGESILNRPLESILFRWFLVNLNPCSSHLWFIGAYLYVLCIAYFVDKWHLWQQMYWFIFPLFITGYFLQLLHYPLSLSRNFLFDGLPCFMLGSWLCTNRNLYAPLKRIKQLKWIVIGIAFLPFCEDFLLNKLAFVKEADLFLTSILFAACLLILAVETPQHIAVQLPSNTHSIVLGVYIFHIFVGFMYEHLLPSSLLHVYQMWLSPILVFVTTWLLCAFFMRLFPKK